MATENRGGLPLRHGAAPVDNSHRPMLELRSSGHVFQNEGETLTKKGALPKFLGSVTLTRERREARALRSERAIRSP